MLNPQSCQIEAKKKASTTLARGGNVRVVAAGRWPEILRALGMNDRVLSGKHGPCPLCGGTDRFHFDDKEGRGTYFCSGCGPGDGINFVMKLKGLSFKEAAQLIEQIAGSVQPSAIKCQPTDEEKRENLRTVWKGSAPIQQGDQVVRYLRGRGLRIDALPESIRFHPSLAYRDEDVVANYPAMLATVSGPNGHALSLHRTYLQGAQKAPVLHPKKLMQGLPLSGAAIRLAGVSERLGIAEGIETALAATELFGIPVWSCISTSGIESFIPPSGVLEVVIFADHDLNFAGQKAAYAAAYRLTQRGIGVEVKMPEFQGDWLDVLLSSRRS